MPCYIESLPAEILRMIIVQLHDLVSLDVLIQASPNAFRVFDRDALGLIEGIMDSDNFSEHIRGMVLTIVRLRTGTLAVSGLGSFRVGVTLEAMQERYMRYRSGTSPLSEGSLEEFRRGFVGEHDGENGDRDEGGAALAAAADTWEEEENGDADGDRTNEDSPRSISRSNIFKHFMNTGIPPIHRDRHAPPHRETSPLLHICDGDQSVLEMMLQRGYGRNRMKGPFPPMDIPLSTSSAVLRGVLATARRIDGLARDCLEFYLEKFRKLQPLHLVDRKFHFKGVKPWESKFEQTPYKSVDVGPPSWYEAQRCTRAFWRLQVLADLRKAAIHELLPGWSEADKETVQKDGVLDLCYMRDLYGIMYRMEPHPEWEEIVAVELYLRDAVEVDVLDYLGQSLKCTNSYSSGIGKYWPPACPHEVDWDVLEGPSKGVEFYHEFVDPGSGTIGIGLPPLQHISINSFRRFGFTFWDEERMAAYGLLACEPSRPSDRYEKTYWMFVWRSLLDREEVEEQERGWSELKGIWRGTNWVQVGGESNWIGIYESDEDEVI